MEERLLFDKNEFIFTDTSVKPAINHTITADRIKSVVFENRKYRKFFGIIKKNTRVISIEVVGISRPLELYEYKELAFVKYLQQLSDFAVKNKIRITDKL